MKNWLLFIPVLVLCGRLSGRPAPGNYRGILFLDKTRTVTLPFNFELSYKGKRPVIVVRNADERITITEINFRGDSMHFRMPVFDTEFRTRVTPTGLEGVWINHYRKNERIIPFVAVRGADTRFANEAGSVADIGGRWRCTFSPGSTDSTPAVGLFRHIEQTPYISGTFLTETGDYRYLEGVLAGDSLYLSAFDGNRAYLFAARVNGDTLKGTFFSGMHWQEPWVGVRDNDFTLREAGSITTVKDTLPPGFSFKNTRGKVVSLADRKYRNKPVIVQVMGSWCANCMDESRYLSTLHRKYKNAGLEVVALAFEKTNGRRAVQQVKRMKERLSLPYEVLVTDATGKDAASKVFPSLSGVIAFPTTLFLDRHHRIVKVHTGFSGPATGREFEKFSLETERLIQQLLR